MTFTIHYISIAIEIIIAILGLIIFARKKKYYGLAFFITFGIYVFYDLAKFLVWNISSSVLNILFLLASLSALYAVLKIYKLK